VEFVNHLDRKSIREKDGVHFGFGFDVPDGQIRMETPWAVVRPNVDQLPGACRNWFTVQRWLDISAERFGVTWAPLDAPLVQIGRITANLLGTVRFNEWMTNAIESSTIYSWAQNNHWHTNYKIDQPGLTTFRFAVRAHARGYSAMESAQFGCETSRPLLVAKASSMPRPERPLLELDSQAAMVETVKPSSDRKAIIVRLFGVTGKDASVRLKWRAPQPTAVYLTDLTERPLQKVNGSTRVPAFGVVHLRAELYPHTPPTAVLESSLIERAGLKESALR
jgi:alpha-mannosidase